MNSDKVSASVSGNGGSNNNNKIISKEANKINSSKNIYSSTTSVRGSSAKP